VSENVNWLKTGICGDKVKFDFCCLYLQVITVMGTTELYA
jgi:hypothetical protein